MEVQASHHAFLKRAYAMKKHHATRLHYDLRLEYNGVLLSWALPEGFTCHAGVAHKAIEVENHRREYLTFEGVHTTGTIMLWDRGAWEPHAGFEDVEEYLRRGTLRFALYGEKLKGSWALIRTSSAGNALRSIWMLSKLADSFAENNPDQNILEEQPNSVSTGRTMEDIGRDWKEGRKKQKRQTKLFE